MNKLPKSLVRCRTVIFSALSALIAFFIVGKFILISQAENKVLLAPSVTASKTVAFATGGDADGDGKADPGDTLQYLVTINNTGAGATDATGVTLADTLQSITTLSGTVNVSPIAVNDSYNAIGNVQMVIPDGAGDLLSNDFDPDGDALTFISPPTTTAQGGSLTVSANGSFTYNPPRGYSGADSFTYTVSDGQGGTNSATVSITVTGVIWFINPAAAADGDGRFTTPYKNLSTFNAANALGGGANPDNGDAIFLYSGAHVAPLTLRASQILIGQGASASISVLEPSKQYLKWVINRELAASDATFDAGELVFAATSYGALNDWRLDDKLNRSCEKLVDSLPGNGRLPSKRPFHADERGYRSVPIGCEMSRALGNLLQKTGYDFNEEFVSKMLGVFDENQIELDENSSKDKLIGWNFEGAPQPDKPAVWVTAISVISLDRIVRMLNARINEIILRHFDVTKHERPHTKMTLHDLIYSDYGLVTQHFKKEDRLLALNLQKMRAHIMRATLPKNYGKDKKTFSAIFYGSPGTGKTTLAESLALSSKAPLIKLSPSDLILQGQELIEGRARDVFEALSMLTQCVVIFDEFEPVLKNRKKEEIQTSKFIYNDASYNTQEMSAYDVARMSVALQKISQQDDLKFRFVLGGMLPKFGKLHDAAEKQSFVYCLGTNILNDIDDAAKRKGRFDKKFPVYKPDALSRAGTLLYRLSQAAEFNQIDQNREKKKFYEVCRRIVKVTAGTIGESAEQINKLFKVEIKDDGKKIESDVLKYILGQPEIILPEEFTRTSLKEKLEDLKNEIFQSPADIYEREDEQRNWLIQREENLQETSEVVKETIKDAMEVSDVIKALELHLKPGGQATI